MPDQLRVGIDDLNQPCVCAAVRAPRLRSGTSRAATSRHVRAVYGQSGSGVRAEQGRRPARVDRTAQRGRAARRSMAWYCPAGRQAAEIDQLCGPGSFR